MQRSLPSQIKAFLLSKGPFLGPLVLGYSGGFDSKALFYLLLDLKKELGFDLVLAHVDHRWRKESAKEARQLKREAASLKIPFFLKTLPKQISSKSQEAWCREQRLAFFQAVCQKLKASALVLAHQKEDLAETVLKRFLEGADLPFLYGLKDESFFQSMRILRPLLKISKAELISFLKERKIIAINDKTNFSSKYLRGRMRSAILPQLSRLFGKEIFNNLVLASDRALALKSGLDAEAEKVLSQGQKTFFGAHLNLASFLEGVSWKSDLFKVRYLIKKWALAAGFSLSYLNLERVLQALEKKASFSLRLKEGELFLEQQKLFFWSRLKKLRFEAKLALKKGFFQGNGWQMQVEEIHQGRLKVPDWQEWLTGSVEIVLPQDLASKTGYFLSAYQPGLKLLKKSLSRHLAEKKVPSFLRGRLPLVFHGDKPFCDLLTGQARFSEINLKKEFKSYYKIKLIIN